MLFTTDKEFQEIYMVSGNEERWGMEDRMKNISSIRRIRIEVTKIPLLIKQPRKT